MTAIASIYHRLAELAGRLLPETVLLLVARLGIAAVFFQSGRTKVEGWLTITDSTSSRSCCCSASARALLRSAFSA